MKIDYRTAALVSDVVKEFTEVGESYTNELVRVFRGGAYDVPEASICLPADEQVLTDVAAVTKVLKTQDLKYIVVIGIGGSSLGAKAVYDALHGHADLEPQLFPKCIFVETLEVSQIERVTALLLNLRSSTEFAMVVTSKSGTTTETIANAAALYGALQPRFGDLASRIAVVSDAESPLIEFAQRESFLSISIPRAVGGRFSVFSAAGLLPLALVGVDLQQLLQGAREIVESVAEGDRAPFETAQWLFHHMQRGYCVHDLFLFSPRLESLGKWYRQLLAESIGKEIKTDSGTQRVGITPTVSIGTSDLHSVAQLHIAGPRDTVTTFVSLTPTSPSLSVSGAFLELIPAVEGRTFDEILSATLEGVKQTYKAAELPFVTCELDQVSERELGAFMQFFMLQTMYLGKLAGVNAFDQPAVELYKQKTQTLLSS